MRLVADGSTSPTLLREVSDWQDHPAWLSFRAGTIPSYGAGATAAASTMNSMDEVCQRICIELADRMRTFHCQDAHS